MRILGVSALYHDAAAALVVDGEIVAAAQEERFTRLKNDAAMPSQAMASCLEAGDVPPDGIDVVAYYEKPLTSFVRVLKTFTAIGPRGFRTFPRAMDEGLRNKLWAGYEIDRALRALGFVLGSSMLATMGCGFDAATPAAAPQNTCTLVDDCLAGTCVEGLCVEPAPEALRSSTVNMGVSLVLLV